MAWWAAGGATGVGGEFSPLIVRGITAEEPAYNAGLPQEAISRDHFRWT
jgi:hypothetical protein